MRTQSPLSVITPSVDGDVLAVLARADQAFTISEIRSLVGGRSPEGIRRALARLADEGIVLTQVAGRTALYRLNRDHLAAPSVIALAHLSETLLERLVAELQGWRERPVYAALFGSAARRDMHAASDLDLFLLQPDDHSEDWDEQVATLVRRARGWTGNDPRVLQLAESDARDAAAEDPVLQSVADEGVPLVGAPGAFRRLIGAR